MPSIFIFWRQFSRKWRKKCLSLLILLLMDMLLWNFIALLLQNYYIYYLYLMMSWITFRELWTLSSEIATLFCMRQCKRQRCGVLHTWVQIVVLSYHFSASLMSLSITLLIWDMKIMVLLICVGFQWEVEVTCIKNLV